jgi:hypothetical protein
MPPIKLFHVTTIVREYSGYKDVDWKVHARAARIESIARDPKIGLKRQGRELIEAYPRCGGHDRFAINVEKGCFNCRGCNAKGDVIALVRFLDDCSFEVACEKIDGDFGERVPIWDERLVDGWLEAAFQKPDAAGVAARGDGRMNTKRYHLIQLQGPHARSTRALPTHARR